MLLASVDKFLSLWMLVVLALIDSYFAKHYDRVAHCMWPGLAMPITSLHAILYLKTGGPKGTERGTC